MINHVWKNLSYQWWKCFHIENMFKTHEKKHYFTFFKPSDGPLWIFLDSQPLKIVMSCSKETIYIMLKKDFFGFHSVFGLSRRCGLIQPPLHSSNIQKPRPIRVNFFITRVMVDFLAANPKKFEILKYSYKIILSLCHKRWL